MSGKEHRALKTVHLGVIANAAIPYSQELTRVTRALLDFIYLAQLPLHTDKTLAKYKEAYRQFHKLKGVWIKNGARQGEKGDVIEHFNIPKLHVAGHLPEQVQAKGVADNYTTETIEHLHINTLKEPYKATNRKNWHEQTVRYLIRRDKITDFNLYLDWMTNRQQSWQGAMDNLASIGIAGKPLPQIHVQSVYYPEDSQPNLSLTMQAPPIPYPLAPNHVPTGIPSQPAWVLAPTQQPKKRKRMTEEEKEEQNVKRTVQSQETYGLGLHQEITLEPIA
ncbi:hypothetical protein FRC08_007547 [Ceratobasidium sp. 394]|nr:hypothetical protein FRC08_007547 [Ceratobasidium sp. 394]